MNQSYLYLYYYQNEYIFILLFKWILVKIFNPYFWLFSLKLIWDQSGLELPSFGEIKIYIVFYEPQLTFPFSNRG